jgi:predicted transcriptional regulator
VDYISPLVVAKDIMRTTVFSVKEDESMLKAAVLMKKKNIHRLIVINKDNIPVGYVSRNEICKAFMI